MPKLTAMITITPTVKHFIEITLNAEITAATQLKVNGELAEAVTGDQCSQAAADGWVKYEGSGWCCGWKYENGHLVYKCVPC